MNESHWALSVLNRASGRGKDSGRMTYPTHAHRLNIQHMQYMVVLQNRFLRLQSGRHLK